MQLIFNTFVKTPNPCKAEREQNAVNLNVNFLRLNLATLSAITCNIFVPDRSQMQWQMKHSTLLVLVLLFCCVVGCSCFDTGGIV